MWASGGASSFVYVLIFRSIVKIKNPCFHVILTWSQEARFVFVFIKMANSANIPNLLCIWKLARDHIF